MNGKNQDEKETPKAAPPAESPFLEQLGSVLPARGRVLIIPHDYPDPDALASAASLELLLARRWGLRGQIVFSGEVSRAENRELLRQMRYRWYPLANLRTPKRKPVPCILVDTTPWAGNVTLPDWVDPIAVIDHHPIPAGASIGHAMAAIEPDVGATATLMFEYLRQSDIAPPKWLSTVLLYAIITETMDFSREVTDRDLAAYTTLTGCANLGLLGKIRNAPLPRGYFSHLQAAMSNAIVFGRVAWTRLGQVDHPEIVGEFADLLLRMERITWSFCLAEVGDRLLVSVRSCQKGARCGRVLRRAIGRHGSAGGHDSLAAGYLLLEGLDPEQRETLEEGLIRALVSRIERRSGFTRTSGTLSAQPLIEPEPPAPAET